MLTVLLETVVYLCIGLIMMMLGHWIIDLFIRLIFRRKSEKAINP